MNKISLKSTFTNYKFNVLFFGFIILYFLIYGPYGYDDADNGWTLATSWRIFNGQIPYRDILLIRPPLSPIFHSIILFIVPPTLQLIFSRLLFYILMALSAFFASSILNKSLKLNINTYLLATLGFVFSVHNFPPMAWHTVDAIFFSVLGLYLLTIKDSYISLFGGVLSLFFAALCKQPFYLMPILGILYVLMSHSNLKRIVITFIFFTVLLLSFVFILTNLNILHDFINYTSGSTSISDLIQSGFKNYLNINIVYFLIPFIFWLIIRSTKVYEKYKLDKSLMSFLFIAIVLLYPIIPLLKGLLHHQYNYNVMFNPSLSRLLFLITFLFLLSNLNRLKVFLPLWFLLSISWCASISWGYAMPVLFSTPLIYGFILVSNQYFDVKNVTKLAISILCLGSIVYFIAYQKPYCNPIRSELKYDLSNIFPKLSYIKVSKETFDKYNELFLLHKKYGDNFKTLPGMPLSNYLTDTQSPINIDWVINAETSNHNDDLINILKAKNTIIFIEKIPQLISVDSTNNKFNSSVTFYIKNNWNKIDECNNFEVYRYKSN